MHSLSIIISGLVFDKPLTRVSKLALMLEWFQAKMKT